MRNPPDLRRRGDYSLALVFAERVDRLAAWKNALEGFSMIESPLIAELLADAKSKAKTEAKAESLLRVLRKRYRELPEDLATSVRVCIDGDQLDRWLDVALDAETLAQFRQQTGL